MEFSSGMEAEAELFKELLKIFPESLIHLGPKFDDKGNEKEVSDVLVILGDVLISFQCKWKELEATNLTETTQKRVSKAIAKGVQQHRTLQKIIDQKLRIFDKSSKEQIEPWPIVFRRIYFVTILSMSDEEYEDPTRRFCIAEKIEYQRKSQVHCLLWRDIPDMLKHLTTPGDFIWYLDFRSDAERNRLECKNELDALTVFKKHLHELANQRNIGVEVGYFENSEQSLSQDSYLEYSKLYDRTLEEIENRGLLAEIEITTESTLNRGRTVSLHILGLLSLVTRGERYYFSESLEEKLKSMEQGNGSFVLTSSQGEFAIGVNISSGFKAYETVNGAIMLCCVGMKKTDRTSAIGLNLRIEHERLSCDAFLLYKEKIVPFEELSGVDILSPAEELRTYHDSLNSRSRERYRK